MMCLTLSQKLLTLIKKHPYIALAIGCLSLTAFNQTSGNEGLLSGKSKYIVFAAFLLSALVLFARLYTSAITKRGKTSAFAALEAYGFTALYAIAFAVCYGIYIKNTEADYVTKFILLSVVAICFIYVLFRADGGKLSLGKAVLLFVLGGVALRFAYCLVITSTHWQHDVGSFPLISGKDSSGHAAYIQHFYENILPPDSRRFQFYQPPFHYFIAGMWLRLQTAFGYSFARAVENIQILTLFYSSACIITTYKIAKELNFKKIGTFIVVSLASFHPTFIILSSSINNDMLCITLMLAAMLCTVKWYKNPTLFNILKIALSVGLSMMSKFNGAYIAPAIALVFLIKLLSAYNKKEAKKEPKRESSIKRFFTTAPDDFINQMAHFVYFGVVCVPLGIWWQVCNVLKHNMSFFYVPLLGSASSNQYVGNFSKWQRLFDLSNFRDVLSASGDYVRVNYEAYNKANPNEIPKRIDYNIPLAATKTALYGEYTLGWGNIVCESVAIIMYYSSVALAVFSLAAMLYFTVRVFVKRAATEEQRTQNVFVIFLTAFYFTMVPLYVKFCFDYPHNCTMDFRYIVPTLIITGLFAGMAADKLESKKTFESKVLLAVLLTVTVLFIASAVIFYAAGILTKI